MFQIEKKVPYYDTGPSGRMKASAAMRLLQQTSGDELDAMGLTYEKLYSEGQVFLLVKTCLMVERMPLGGETVVAKTVPTKTKGARFFRDIVLDDLEGNRLVSALTLWALVDTNSRKILRPRDFPYTLNFQESITTGFVKEVGFPKLEAENSDFRHEFPILYSHLDNNGHVNNSYYMDFACDYLPADTLGDGQVKCIEVAYQNEALLGDVITLDRYDLGSRSFYFVGSVNKTQPCFQLKLKLA